jgi:hypothetical protein
MNARNTPMERNKDSIAGEVRGSLGGLIAGPRSDQIDPAGHCREGCRQMDKECIFDRSVIWCRWSPIAGRTRFNRWPDAGN